MERLKNLFVLKYQESPDRIEPLKGDASDRRIYRLSNAHRSVVGIIGENRAENRAFLEFSRHFKKFGLNVPEIYIENLEQGVYLEEDLGNDTLFLWMNQIREQEGFSDRITTMYQKVIEALPHFQITAGKSIDYSLCYQYMEFAEESMSWDLQYFKQRFLDMFYKKSINETALEKDFRRLIQYLLEEPREYFLYRDFQSRNVMIKHNQPYFIDYQSGRKGALQYDLASLLYDAKADIPEEIRQKLIGVYLKQVGELVPIDPERFMKYFYEFVYLRIMQAFGAYGYLSVMKGKKDFFKSVPFAIRNLEILLEKKTLLRELPTLTEIFWNLVEDRSLRAPDGQKEAQPDSKDSLF